MEFVSTGRLPHPDLVQSLVDEAYERYRGVPEGLPSREYPGLAAVRSDLFGICLLGTDGSEYSAGDVTTSSR